MLWISQLVSITKVYNLPRILGSIIRTCNDFFISKASLKYLTKTPFVENFLKD